VCNVSSVGAVRQCASVQPGAALRAGREVSLRCTRVRKLAFAGVRCPLAVVGAQYPWQCARAHFGRHGHGRRRAMRPLPLSNSPSLHLRRAIPFVHVSIWIVFAELGYKPIPMAKIPYFLSEREHITWHLHHRWNLKEGVWVSLYEGVKASIRTWRIPAQSRAPSLVQGCAEGSNGPRRLGSPS
jgi:hypothetical protein